MTKVLPLRNSQLVAIVDDDDYERLCAYRWNLKNSGYVGRGKSLSILLHREIANAPKGVICDHINRQVLDNRKENLRLVTASQSVSNRGPYGGRQYKGVMYDRGRGTWGARIQRKDYRRWLGVFSSPEDAARAYDKAAREMYGEFAVLNFPEDGERGGQ